MKWPDAAQTGSGGYSIKTTQLDGGKWMASVEAPGVDPVTAPREVEAIRAMTKVLDTYVKQAPGKNT